MSRAAGVGGGVEMSWSWLNEWSWPADGDGDGWPRERCPVSSLLATCEPRPGAPPPLLTSGHSSHATTDCTGVTRKWSGHCSLLLLRLPFRV